MAYLWCVFDALYRVPMVIPETSVNVVSEELEETRYTVFT